MSNDLTNPPPVIQTIESELPANAGFGQNGYRGPSSVPLGQQFELTPFSPPDDDAKSILKAGGMSFARQTRKISNRPAAPHAHGMRDRNVNPVKVGANMRPVTRRT